MTFGLFTPLESLIAALNSQAQQILFIYFLPFLKREVLDFQIRFK